MVSISFLRSAVFAIFAITLSSDEFPFGRLPAGAGMVSGVTDDRLAYGQRWGSRQAQFLYSPFLIDFTLPLRYSSAERERVPWITLARPNQSPALETLDAGLLMLRIGAGFFSSHSSDSPR